MADHIECKMVCPTFFFRSIAPIFRENPLSKAKHCVHIVLVHGLAVQHFLDDVGLPWGAWRQSFCFLNRLLLRKRSIRFVLPHYIYNAFAFRVSVSFLLLLHFRWTGIVVYPLAWIQQESPATLCADGVRYFPCCVSSQPTRFRCRFVFSVSH